MISQAKYRKLILRFDSILPAYFCNIVLSLSPPSLSGVWGVCVYMCLYVHTHVHFQWRHALSNQVMGHM